MLRNRWYTLLRNQWYTFARNRWYTFPGILIQEPEFQYLPVTEGKRGRKRQSIHVESTVPGAIKLSVLGTGVAEEDWQRLELRLDSRGKPLVVEAVSMRVWPAYSWRKGMRHEEVWLMIERRSLSRGGYELRYFFSNMPQQLTTLDLAKVYHERYWIEQGYQQLKEELGLDHHEGRSWKGWHRHVLLAFLAYGYLTQVRLRKKKERNQAARAEWLQEKSVLSSDAFF